MESSKKITWIIGDIHGMYDPLRAIVEHLDNEWLDKFVFVGDYIDYGPSSKEVLDLIISLGDRAITLMGNHEYLLLQTLYDKRHREHYGYRVWEDNGAESTIRSFNCKTFEEFEARIEAKYTDFLKNLCCFHTETVPCGAGEMTFLITHAGILPNIPLEEQLAINSYASFNRFIEKKGVWIENSFIWVREDFFGCHPDKWQGYLIIHGHTPTHLLGYYASDSPPDESTHFLYLRKHPRSGNIVSIDVDTGAAFGNRLTALGLSHEEGYRDHRSALPVHLAQLDIKEGYYRQRPIKFKTLDIPIATPEDSTIGRT